MSAFTIDKGLPQMGGVETGKILPPEHKLFKAFRRQGDPPVPGGSLVDVVVEGPGADSHGLAQGPGPGLQLAMAEGTSLMWCSTFLGKKMK